MSRKHRIFISSVQKELASERRALRDFIEGDALLRRFFEVFLFEDLPASDRRADDVYLGEVDRCGIYIGIFGNEYGAEDAEGVAPTEREFDRSGQKNRMRLIFVKGTDDKSRHPKMLALVRKASSLLVRRRFSSTPELTTSVYASLVDNLVRTGAIHTGPFDGASCARATLVDLAKSKVTAFLARARAERGYPLGARTTLRAALAHLNLLDGALPTNAAVLLFGKEPQRFLPTSIVKCLHFHGTEIEKPIPSYQVYKGTIFELVDQAVEFVLSRIDRRVGTRATGPQAPVAYELPPEAVTEAIVNAVAHRDYASNASVQVMLFSDRLEIWNPGELPPALNFRTLKEPHPSFPHNPLIAEPLFLTRYIERAGTGILDMVKLCSTAGLRAPDFREANGQFIQVLWRPSAASKRREADTSSLGPAQEAQVEAQEAQVVLTAVALSILHACKQAPQSGRTLLDAAGYTSRTGNFKRSLDRLVQGGYLEMTVAGKPRSSKQEYRLTVKGRNAIAVGLT